MGHGHRNPSILLAESTLISMPKAPPKMNTRRDRLDGDVDIQIDSGIHIPTLLQKRDGVKWKTSDLTDCLNETIPLVQGS